MIQTASPAIGAATRTTSSSANGSTNTSASAPPAMAPSVPAMNCAGDVVSTRRSTTPSARFEEPAEEPAGHVAEQAAEHPAQPVGRRAQVASGPEARRGAEHHDEQAYSLDEHGSLVDTIRAAHEGSASGSRRSPSARRGLPPVLISGRERIVPMRT